MCVLLNRDRVGRHLLLRGRREKLILKLLDVGIISRGASEWASPTVLVRKRDGTVSVRYCIDLRKVLTELPLRIGTQGRHLSFKVLSQFRNFKLKLKPSKCELLKSDIILLGHKVSRDG